MIIVCKLGCNCFYISSCLCTIVQVEEAVAVLHAHQAKEAAGVGGKVE